MNVRELITKLQKLDPEKPVYKSFFDCSQSAQEPIDEVYECSETEYTGYQITKTTPIVVIS